MLEQQELRSQAVPATTLTFDPNEATKTVGETFTLSVTINTGSNSVSGAELHIQYDSSKLTAVSIDIADEPFLPLVLVDGTAAGGFAFITLGSQPDKPKKGTGTLATITFRATASTGGAPTLVKFTTDTRIAGTGEIGNVLASQPAPASITINTAGPSPTPTTADTCVPSDCSLCAQGAVCKQVPDVVVKQCSCQFPTTPTPKGGGGVGGGGALTPTPTGRVGIGRTAPTATPTLIAKGGTPTGAQPTAGPIPETADIAPTTILTVGGAVLFLIGVASFLLF